MPAAHDALILVTGAAGRIGSVGRMVAEQLLAEGFRVALKCGSTTRVRLRCGSEAPTS